jgi:nucleotide-binding universal stress UspA family protein
MSEGERQRIEDTTRNTLLPTGPLRMLVPTAGGENAMEAMRLAAPLARHDRGQLTALYVDVTPNGPGRRRLLTRRASLAGTNLDAHLARAAGLFGNGDGHFQPRRVTGPDVAEAVLDETARDYDLVFLGAARTRPLHDPLVRRIVEESPIGVVVVRQGEDGSEGPFRRILVPVDGSRFSRYAAEVAFAYAGATGADVTVLHVANEHRLAPGSIPVSNRRDARALAWDRTRDIERQLEQAFSPLAGPHGARLETRVFASGSPGQTIIDESRSGRYDLLILGSENKMLGRPLLFGQGTAEIVESSRCATAVVLRGTA